MSDPQAPLIPPVETASRWRRRVRKILVLLLLLLVGVPLGLYGFYWLLGRHRLSEAGALADRLDPGWRLEEMEARREIVPDEENAALVVIEAAWLTPEYWPSLPRIPVVPRQELEYATLTVPEGTPRPPRPLLPRIEHFTGARMVERVEETPPERQLDANLAGDLRTELAHVDAACAKARMLAQMPRGRYPLVQGKSLRDSPHLEVCLHVGRLLWLDAAHLVQDDNIDGATRSGLAMLNAARSIGDEPLPLAQVVRRMIIMMNVRLLSRVLGQGQASPERLALFQEILENETHQPYLLLSLRGERALQDRIWKAIEAGENSLWLLRTPDSPGPNASFFQDWGYLPDYADSRWRLVPQLGHAWSLNYLTEAVEIAKQPSGDLAERFEELDARMHAQSLLNDAKPFFECQDIWYLSQHREGVLRSSVAALASERYRIKHGRWPDSWNELIVAGYLRQPIDPFDGQPMRLLRLRDGIVIYSVGPDSVDNGGKLKHQFLMGRGLDLGFRLWDVPLRRQPPAEPEPIAAP